MFAWKVCCWRCWTVSGGSGTEPIVGESSSRPILAEDTELLRSATDDSGKKVRIGCSSEAGSSNYSTMSEANVDGLDGADGRQHARLGPRRSDDASAKRSPVCSLPTNHCPTPAARVIKVAVFGAPMVYTLFINFFGN